MLSKLEKILIFTNAFAMFLNITAMLIFYQLLKWSEESSSIPILTGCT